MTRQQCSALAVILFIMFLLQISNTPALTDKGWLIIILIGIFNVAAFYLIGSAKKDDNK